MSGKALIGLLTVVQICCFAWEVNSAEFCVGTALELEDALSLSVANGESDIVKIQRGTYIGDFQFVSYEDTDISILGGYGPACTARVIDPTNTVLDADGSPTPLSFNKYSDGDVVVEGLTMQNGGYRGFYIRLFNESGHVGSIDINSNIITNNKPKGGIYIGSSCSPPFTAGSVRLVGNVITGNISDYGGGGLSIQLLWGDFPNEVVLINNVVAGNIGSSTSGGVFINPGSETRVYFVNNTIADNQAIGASSDVGGAYIGSFNNSVLYIYNNIIRGNTAGTGVADIWFFNFGSSPRIGFNNSYSELHGTWTDASENGDVDPQFILPGQWDESGTPGDPSDDFWVDGNYHLGETSACIDAGHAAAPELPPTDFEGDSRAVDGDNDGAAVPDIGADEVTIPCSADVEPDGDVDAADLIAFVAAYGSSKGEVNYNPDVDFNVDGSVDDTDLAVLADEFGRINCS